MSDAPWTRRLGKTSLWLVVAALVIAGVGVSLARYDIIAKIPGLFALVGGGVIALLAALIAIPALFLNMRWRAGVGMMAGFALIVGGGYAGFLLSRLATARSVPPIHDITTDLANPPQFTQLRVRVDNLVGVGTLAHWRELHARGYGDIRGITIPRSVAAVTSDAEALARARGWEIVVANPAEGRLEAVAHVSYIRFEDQVVVRVTPMPDGIGSRVDMRSVSRVGIGDQGVNAARIREFLAALSAA
ncbi:MAG: DUF1499 domain-containing protein [Sphingopyxis sp.]